MKKWILLTLATMTCFAQEIADSKPKEEGFRSEPRELFKNSLGLGGSVVGGYGFYYRYWSDEGTGIQFMGMPLYNKDEYSTEFLGNVGVQMMHSVFHKARSRDGLVDQYSINSYFTYGATYEYEYSKYHQSYWGYEEEQNKKSTGRGGFGFGVELGYGHLLLDASLGYAAQYSKNWNDPSSDYSFETFPHVALQAGFLFGSKWGGN